MMESTEKIVSGVLAFQKGRLSQWYGAFSGQQGGFMYDGIRFNCCEQWMMAQKATLFNDEGAYGRVMNTSSPHQQKKIGRTVAGYDQDHWDSYKRDIVYFGNLLKFSQNHDLRQFLKETGELLIVEASPWDKIWGCGTDLEDEDTYDQKKWHGENLLGQALMKVRDVVDNDGIINFRFGDDR
jgi:ribA/ribD-fused uncharacterized protein